MTMSVQIWWFALCVVAILNIAAWGVSVRILMNRHNDFFSAAQHQKQRWMLWLSATYVAGCAFRSFLPRIDLERVCLVQSALSNMMLGRSVATVAELCFIAQGALLLHQAGATTGSSTVSIVSRLLLPLIVVAECASWYAILSKNYLGHVLENSIWTFSAVLLFTSFAFLWPHSDRKQRYFLIAMMLFAITYVGFMTNVDVPMYWSRWNESLMLKTEYLSLTQGVLDASQPCVVNFNWSMWRMEIPWMTLYFTVAVWVSLTLIHTPLWLSGSDRK